MRLLTAIGVAVLAIGVSASSAQELDDLSRLLREDPGPVSLSLQGARVDEILEVMGTIGGFEVYFSRDVAEWPPISLKFQDTDYETVLRAVLNMSGLRYTVVGDNTLLVSRT